MTGRVRQRDREQRLRAANRRIGHDLAYVVVFGPPLVKAALLGAVVYGAWWVWTHVDHARISLAIGMFGVLCLIGYGAWIVQRGSVHHRLMARATGHRHSHWWHALPAAGVLLVFAAVVTARS
jgi:hypothetical protein